MKEHQKKIRANLVKLIEFADLDPNKVDIDSEVPKWPSKYLEEFVDAIPILDEEKLVYILRGIFERNLIDKLTKSYRLNKDTNDKFSNYNRFALTRMKSLGINIDTWINEDISKKFILNNNQGQELIIRPIHDASDSREHLLLGNPHPNEKSCTAARITNITDRSHPDVNLDYLLDSTVRSINIFSKTLNDSVGYIRLVAAEDGKNKPILGCSFMVFTKHFENNHHLISEILKFLSFDPNFAKKTGFQGVEVNYAGDLANINFSTEKKITATLSKVRSNIRVLERKENYINLTDIEKDHLKIFRDLYFSLQQKIKEEVFTKTDIRKRFLQKICWDYQGEWSGARYFDLWGGNNHFYGNTLSSVEGTKGYHYSQLTDICEGLKDKSIH